MNEKLHKWVGRYGGRVFYMGFVVGTGLFIYVFLHRQETIDRSHLVASQIASCHRGNELRRQINAGDRVLSGFLHLAIQSAQRRARLETGAKHASDLLTIKLYTKQAKAFKGVKQIDCETVIKNIADNGVRPTSTTSSLSGMIWFSD